LERDNSAKQLISHNEKEATYHYKYTFKVDLAPVCRDDLVIIPKPLSRMLGGIGPMVLVYKISKFVHIVDIRTMQTFEIDEKNYWKHVFKATLSRDRLSEFIVINIENVDNDFNSSRAAIRQKFRQV
jgi:nonsense-mediated mRNA decay protein 3